MKKPLSTRIVTRTAAALACAVCAVGLMTGCSQGSKADSASEASASATSGDDYLVKAAECLRKEGYDVPDPEAGKGIQLNGDIPQDVMSKCFSEIGNK